MGAETEYSFLEKLRVTVIEAQDLAPKDRNGKADPYAIVSVRKKEHRTKTIEETLNPIWKKEDATFMFEISEEDLGDPDASLKFVLWNKNRASRHDYMGETSVPLQQLLDAAELITTPQKVVDQWMLLESPEGKKGMVTGSIHVSIEIIFSSIESENGEGANNSKIRARFFRHFPTIPTSEKILFLYRCALSSKKIPRKGTIYLLENHLCFYSNLLGKKKKIAIPFDEIQNVEKKFPVAVEVTRKTGKKHFFESFLGRGQAFKDIKAQWGKSVGIPSVSSRSSFNGDQNLGINSTDKAIDGPLSPRGRVGHGHRRMGSLVTKNTQIVIEEKKRDSLNVPNQVPTVTVGAHSFAHAPPSPGHRRGRSQAQQDFNVEINVVPSSPTMSRANAIISPPSTPRSPIQLRSSTTVLPTSPLGRSAREAMPQPIQLNVEFDSWRELKMEKANITMSVVPSKPVQSLLNIISLNHNISTETLSKHIMKCYAYDVMHVHSSKHKVEMDPLNAVSFYGLKEGDTIYLKRRKKGSLIPRSLTFQRKRNSINFLLHVLVDNFEELKCSKQTTVVLENEVTVDELFQKIASEGNVPIDEEDRIYYYLSIVKPNGKSVRGEERNQLISYLGAEDKDTIRISKRMPFHSVKDKYHLIEGRNEREVTFELAAHCLVSQTDSFCPTRRANVISDETRQEWTTHLMKAMKMDSIPASRMLERAKQIKNHGKETILLELSERMKLLEVDKSSYQISSFEDLECYNRWKENEKKEIIEEAKNLIFDEEDFLGILAVRIIESSDIPQGKKSEIFCSVELKGEKIQKKTKPISGKQGELYWDEEFLIHVNKSSASMNLSLISTESANEVVMDSVSIPIEKFAEQREIEEWVSMENGSKVHIFVELNYSFSHYYRAFCSGKGLVEPSSLSSTNYSSCYQTLLRHLAEEDEKEGSEEMLSEESEWILNEFKRRWGIRRNDSQVLMAKTILRHFSTSCERLERLRNILHSLSKRSRSDWTTKEWEEYFLSATELCEKFEDAITQYRYVFQFNKPEGALGMALDCYFLLLSIGTKSETVEKGREMAIGQIYEFLSNSVDSNLLSLKKQYKENYPQRVQALDSPTAHYVLSFICRRLLKEASEEENFERTFKERGIDFSHHVSNRYKELLMNDVWQFCDKAPYENSDVFELFFRLKELRANPFFSKKSNEQSKMDENLSDLFQPFTYAWIKDTKISHTEFTEGSVGKDQCIIESDSSNSSSLFQVFEACENSLEFLKSLALDQPFVVIQFTEVLCQVVEKFIHLSYEKAYSIVATGREENSTPVSVCILMNNIETAREKLDGLITELEEELEKSNERSKHNPNGLTFDILKQTFEDCSRKAFGSARTNLDNLIQLNSDKINNQIKKVLNAAIFGREPSISTVKSQLKTTFEPQLQLLLENLLESTFKKISRKIWGEVVEDLHIIAVAKERDLSHSQIRLILPILEELISIFGLKGKGIPKNYAEESSMNVRKLLELWTQSSSILIDLWWKLKEPMSAKEDRLKGLKFSKTLRESTDNLHRAAASGSPKPTQTLTEITEKDVMSILEHRLDSEEAKAFVEEQKCLQTDAVKYQSIQTTREHFGLPLSEIILRNYGNCTLLNISTDVKQPGFSFLTSNYLCFDVKIDGSNTTTQTMIPLKEIKTLQKTKHAFFWDAILVEVKNGKSYSFFDWKNRDVTWKDICDQAIALGNSSFATEKKET
eukprot:TRINITY_DN2203_c0_g2_i1.p2 TRINITY_DN2203_c0_g2~~TRINITY_DN2203_c0_g2_i1.p2  ORF type:complete len:1713 (-),score=617.89 TRINITY_DN2203_c0_g2_i1:143-5281(-)